MSGARIAHALNGLLIFMEKLNDYPEMTASEICAWLRSAAADAAIVEAESSSV